MIKRHILAFLLSVIAVCVSATAFAEEVGKAELAFNLNSANEEMAWFSVDDEEIGGMTVSVVVRRGPEDGTNPTSPVVVFSAAISATYAGASLGGAEVGDIKDGFVDHGIDGFSGTIRRVVDKSRSIVTYVLYSKGNPGIMPELFAVCSAFVGEPVD